MLAREYGIRHERITQQITDICGRLVDSYWDNNSGDILDIVDGSLLMGYDEAGQEFQFKSAAAISITYAVLERCGFEPEGHFDRDDFQAIFSFSTPAAVYALGTAVSECSRDVLRNIERTVKTTIRRRNVERSQNEYEQQELDLLDNRGLPAPEPDPAPAGKSTGQVRATAPDLPDAASPGAVQLDAPVGDSVSAPVGSGADRREPDAADHAGTADEEPGSEQGAASDGVGAAHEQSESTGRGTGDERADLQLSFFDAHIPTEAEQIESIDQTENEKSSSAFSLSQADIENALRRGSNFENSKLRIWKIYQLQPDRSLRAKALAKEYAPHGPGGSSHTYLDGSSGWLDHDSKGLTFEHYPDHQKVLLRWNQVEKYIDLMIQSDRYLSDKEKRTIEFPLELNAASAAEYTALKEQHPDTLIGFEAGGNFMFYGEDAAKVAKIINSALFTRETTLGEVQVTGFPPSLWARKSKELWSAGNDVYLAGLNEDGTHHQTKYLRKEDYLPIDSVINMDGRKFRIDGVDFDKDKVSLQDMALADMRMPIFREEPLAVVRELYEQQDKALDAAPEKAVDYKVGDSVVVDLPTRTIEGTIGYVGETDVRIDTSAQGYSWSNEVLNRQQFEDGLRQDEPELSDEELDKLPISVEVNGEWQTFPDAAAADEALNAEPVPEAAGNFHITNDHLGEGGAKQKYARNIAAIRTLFKLEDEHRGATAEEQQVLSQYVGWGGLADAFAPDKDNWAKEYTVKEVRPRYSCFYKIRHPGDCDGQSGYGVSKLDSIVEEVVRQIFAQFREVSRKKLLESVKTNDAARIQKKVKKIQKDLESKQKELDDLKAETILVIRGVSALDKELLGTLVAEAREALETLEKQLVQAQEEYEEATKTAKRSNYICNELFTWADVYDTANHDERRAILQQFIAEIGVRKDYEISITLNASFNQVEQLKAVSTYDGAEIFEGISEKGA